MGSRVSWDPASLGIPRLLEAESPRAQHGRRDVDASGQGELWYPQHMDLLTACVAATCVWALLRFLGAPLAAGLAASSEQEPLSGPKSSDFNEIPANRSGDSKSFVLIRHGEVIHGPVPPPGTVHDPGRPSSITPPPAEPTRRASWRGLLFALASTLCGLVGIFAASAWVTYVGLASAVFAAGLSSSTAGFIVGVVRDIRSVLHVVGLGWSVFTTVSLASILLLIQLQTAAVRLDAVRRRLADAGFDTSYLEESAVATPPARGPIARWRLILTSIGMVRFLDGSRRSVYRLTVAVMVPSMLALGGRISDPAFEAQILTLENVYLSTAEQESASAWRAACSEAEAAEGGTHEPWGPDDDRIANALAYQFELAAVPPPFQRRHAGGTETHERTAAARPTPRRTDVAKGTAFRTNPRSWDARTTILELSRAARKKSLDAEVASGEGGEVVQVLRGLREAENRQYPRTELGFRFRTKLRNIAREAPAAWTRIKESTQRELDAFRVRADPADVQTLLRAHVVGSVLAGADVVGEWNPTDAPSFTDLVASRVGHVEGRLTWTFLQALSTGTLDDSVRATREVWEEPRTWASVQDDLRAVMDERPPPRDIVTIASRSALPGIESNPRPGVATGDSLSRSEVSRVAGIGEAGSARTGLVDAPLRPNSEVFEVVRRPTEPPLERIPRAVPFDPVLGSRVEGARSPVRPILPRGRPKGIRLGTAYREYAARVGSEGTAVRDIAWQESEEGISLTLTLLSGESADIGLYPADYIAASLAYAATADDLSITIPPSFEYPESQLVLAEAFMDTRAGCHLARLDLAFKDAIGRSPATPDASMAHAAQCLYQFAWAARANRALQGVDENTQQAAILHASIETGWLEASADYWLNDQDERMSIAERMVRALKDQGIARPSDGLLPDFRSVMAAAKRAVRNVRWPLHEEKVARILEASGEALDKELLALVLGCQRTVSSEAYATCVEARLGSSNPPDMARWIEWLERPPSFSFSAVITDEAAIEGAGLDEMLALSKSIPFSAGSPFSTRVSIHIDKTVLEQEPAQPFPLSIVGDGRAGTTDPLLESLFAISTTGRGVGPPRRVTRRREFVIPLPDETRLGSDLSLDVSWQVLGQVDFLVRLFRKAFDGEFGDEFPVEKLPCLAEAALATRSPYPTPRWVSAADSIVDELAHELNAAAVRARAACLDTETSMGIAWLRSVDDCLSELERWQPSRDWPAACSSGHFTGNDLPCPKAKEAADQVVRAATRAQRAVTFRRTAGVDASKPALRAVSLGCPKHFP